MKARFALACLSVTLANPVVAQSQETETGAPAIIVEGERPHSEDEIKALARQVGADIDPLRPIARFNQPLCLDVAGLKEEYHKRFVRRIADNAGRAGLTIAEPGCRPNAMVLFAEDSRGQLKALRKRKRDLFGEMPRSAFNDMLESRDRVYAWQINEIVDVNGVDLDTNSQFGMGLPVLRTPPVGRLNPPIRLVTRSAAVVIEKSQASGKSPEQLADYATMRLIAPTAELRSDETDGPPTIMTLFSDPARAPATLTAFDTAYLASVYRVRPNGPGAWVFVETASLMQPEDVE